MSFDRDFVDTVRQSVNLVEVVSEHVSLRKQGSRFVGLCPFHDERTPSFSVSADRQLYYCFGCGTGGDVFSFLMKVEGLEFADSVRSLAQRAGLAIPESRGPDEDRKHRERQRLLDVMDLARRYYEGALWETESGGRARSYLEKREIGEDLARSFQIGYALAGWNGLLKALTGRGVTERELETAGLVARSSKNPHRLYDRFRDRLMFPIWDAQGRVVAFGGRILDPEAGPKYVNSPETVLFRKGTLWYGLHLSRAAIRRLEKAVVVEGYMDVIACHGREHQGVVASMGTALSREQAWSLARLAPRVVIAYDADAAGQDATIRGLDMFHQTGIQVRVATMPRGQDPDDVLRSGGSQAWEKIINSAVPLFTYRLERAMGSHDPRTVGGKVGVVRELLPALLSMSDEIRRAEGIKTVSERLGVGEDAIRLELARAARRAGRRREAREIADTGTASPDLEQMAGIPPAVVKAEREIIRLVMDDPRRFEWLKGDPDAGVEPVTPDHFTVPATRELMAAIAQVAADYGEPKPSDVTSVLESEDLKGQLSGLLLEEFVPADPKRTVEDCMMTLVRYQFQKEIEQLQTVIRNAESGGDQLDPQVVRELVVQQERLHRTRRR